MELRYWCARCGQKLFAARRRAGWQARCPTCDYVQPIPVPMSDPTVESPVPAGTDEPRESVYVLAGPPVERQDPRLFSPPFAATARGRAGRESPGELLKSIVLDSSRLQGLSLFLVALSAADLFVTFSLLRTSHAYYEANPVARWFFARWDMAGMAIFKFAVIGFVITLGEIIERRRPGLGRFVLLVGCAGAAAVIWHGLRLYQRAGG